MTRRISTSTQKRLIPFLAIAMAAFVAACASNDAPVEEAPDTSEFQEAPASPPQSNVADTTISAANISISPVYFDLDDSTIKPHFADVLQAAAEALRESGGSVTIEGHCDERGTREYNIGLGERRSDSARRYLVALGINPDRIGTVSYGKERPVCATSNESCWSQNRRGVLVVN